MIYSEPETLGPKDPSGPGGPRSGETKTRRQKGAAVTRSAFLT